MPFCSFVVIAQHPLGITKPLVALDTGVNTFNANVDDLEAFKKYLESEGVVITRVFELDAKTDVDSTDLLLPGERPLLGQ